MTLAFIKSAAAQGAEVVNYLQVIQLLEENGHVVGVEAQDCLTGTKIKIKARIVVNSAGPFVQDVNKSVSGLRLHHKLTGFSRGVHMVTRQLEPEFAMALTTRKKTEGFVTRGGRHFFIIPWRGQSLIGTTNVPLTESLDSIKVTRKDIDDFLLDINEALPSVQLTFADVRYAFTGIYPIIAREIKTDTYQGTGEFQIVDHAVKDGVEGMVTALGAKFTTARNVAEQCVDLVTKKLGGRQSSSRTANIRLWEGDIDDIENFTAHCLQKYSSILDDKSIIHLLQNYGCRIDELIEQGRGQNMLVRLSPDRETLAIEVQYAVQEEMALTLEDVIFRRTGIGTIGYPGDEYIRCCADIMAPLLGWDKAEINTQLNQVRDRYNYT